MTTVSYTDSRLVCHTHIVTRVKGQIYLDHAHIGTFPAHIQDAARAALESDERAIR